MGAAQKALRVVGGVAVIRLEDGAERYLYRGAIVSPDGFDKKSIEHHVSIGLVEEIDLPDDESGSAVPEGVPTEDWTGKELDAFAAANGIDISKAKNKAEKVAALTAAPA